METKTRKYLEILKIELEDLIYDLEFSENVLAKRLQEHEITEYVFLENIGLLKKEILGIERIKLMLKESDKQIGSINELRDRIESYFQDEIKSAGLPDVVFLLISRKLEKVCRYMALDE
ncbi:MAG TPA: hypothetical protein DCO79_12240 [Spirochaeta sp.]|nr:hypothetical protein [Spirochaeta sp.]